MKRWLTVGIAAGMLLACAGLFFHLGVNPENFQGDWYHVGDGSLYRFQEGILESPEYGYVLSDGSMFSGAYSFSRNTVAVFLITDQGPTPVLQLHLALSPQGDVLREGEDETARVVFYRSRDAALENPGA